MRHHNTTHGHTPTGNHSPTYVSWRSMLMRCYQPSMGAYPYYGAKGITVCDRWRHSFENFLADVGLRPSRDYSLDRYPNRDGNYEPGNVRWATLFEQADNRRSTRLVTIGGETLSVKNWSRRSGIFHGTLLQRVNAGWPEDQILRPVDARKRCRLSRSDVGVIQRAAADGRSFADLAEQFGVHYETIRVIVRRRARVVQL